MRLRQTLKRNQGRGFTLIELLVSVIAGMLVAATAFSFSKHSTRLFSQEARIAATQMGVLTGFQRLQNDVSRASHMSTPGLPWEIGQHQVKAAALYSSWPEEAPGAYFKSMRRMAGFRVDKGSSTFTGIQAPAMPDGLVPDAIRIIGNMGTPEVFFTDGAAPSGEAIAECSPNLSIQLSVRRGTDATSSYYGGMLRSGLISSSDKQGRMQEIFKPGRWLRYRLTTKLVESVQYTVITKSGYIAGTPGVYYVCTANGPTELQINVDGKAIAGLGTGVIINPISVIEYSVGKLAGAAYTNSIYASPALDDASRTELIRKEVLYNADLSQQDSALWPTELVAEYTVDLRVGLRVSPAVGATEYLAPTAADTSKINTLMTGQAVYNDYDRPSGPESVRAVELRLVVRNMERDRTVDLDPVTGKIAAGSGLIFRYPLPTPAAPAGNAFARTRTLTADVSLQNQFGVPE